MDISNLPLLADAAPTAISLWDHIGLFIEKLRPNSNFLEDYPTLLSFVKSTWEFILVVCAGIAALIFNPMRLATIVGSNLLYIYQTLFSNDVVQKMINSKRIIMGDRVKTTKTYEDTAAERGDRQKQYRDTIAGERIGGEGPYAVSLMLEITFFNATYLTVRNKLKEAFRKLLELEEIIDARLLELYEEIEKVSAPFKAELDRLTVELDEANAELDEQNAEMMRHQTMFGYLRNLPKKRRAAKVSKRLKKELKKKRRELGKLINPLRKVCDSELRSRLQQLDAVERYEVIPLIERLRGSFRSSVTAVQVGRTLRKLIDPNDPQGQRAREALQLTGLFRQENITSRNSLEEFLKKHLNGKVAFAPHTATEDYLEAFLRLDLSRALPETLGNLGIDKLWLANLCPPAGKGLVLKEFPFGRPWKIPA